MRHIKIRNLSDLFRPAIRAYLQEACERAGFEVATEKEKTVTTVVKRKSLPRRIIGTSRIQLGRKRPAREPYPTKSLVVAVRNCIYPTKSLVVAVSRGNHDVFCRLILIASCPFCQSAKPVWVQLDLSRCAAAPAEAGAYS